MRFRRLFAGVDFKRCFCVLPVAVAPPFVACAPKANAKAKAKAYAQAIPAPAPKRGAVFRTRDIMQGPQFHSMNFGSGIHLSNDSREILLNLYNELKKSQKEDYTLGERQNMRKRPINLEQEFNRFSGGFSVRVVKKARADVTEGYLQQQKRRGRAPKQKLELTLPELDDWVGAYVFSNSEFEWIFFLTFQKMCF